jgi:hypothetical protein
MLPRLVLTFTPAELESVRTAFDAFVDRNGPIPAHLPHLGPCWPWKGGRSGRRYGGLRVQGQLIRAHRLSFFLTHGRWPMPCCLHRCDNPPCVRPEHLREGTQLENCADMVAKGRCVRTPAPGEANGNAKLTEEQAREIRARSSESQAALAREFGVSPATICMVIKGQRWRYLAA